MDSRGELRQPPVDAGGTLIDQQRVLVRSRAAASQFGGGLWVELWLTWVPVTSGLVTSGGWSMPRGRPGRRTCTVEDMAWTNAGGPLWIHPPLYTVPHNSRTSPRGDRRGGQTYGEVLNKSGRRGLTLSNS